jgi:hypothetical protein
VVGGCYLVRSRECASDDVSMVFTAAHCTLSFSRLVSSPLSPPAFTQGEGAGGGDAYVLGWAADTVFLGRRCLSTEGRLLIGVLEHQPATSPPLFQLLLSAVDLPPLSFPRKGKTC